MSVFQTKVEPRERGSVESLRAPTTALDVDQEPAHGAGRDVRVAPRNGFLVGGKTEGEGREAKPEEAILGINRGGEGGGRPCLGSSEDVRRGRDRGTSTCRCAVSPNLSLSLFPGKLFVFCLPP